VSQNIIFLANIYPNRKYCKDITGRIKESLEKVLGLNIAQDYMIMRAIVK
jgi:hypothetical protein